MCHSFVTIATRVADACLPNKCLPNKAVTKICRIEEQANVFSLQVMAVSIEPHPLSANVYLLFFRHFVLLCSLNILPQVCFITSPRQLL